MAGPPGAPSVSDPEDDDSILANSKVLTRQEVLERRARRLRRLAKCYRVHYWLLMEEVRRQHREFYWKYGKSPYKLEESNADQGENGVASVSVNNNNLHIFDDNVGNSNRLGSELEGSYRECSQSACGKKALALTKYCMRHITLDTKQMLYKGCIFPSRRDDGPHGRILHGPVLCGKAVLKSVTPSLCETHVLSTKSQIRNALKKAGVSPVLSTKLTSKFHFHLVIKEYVHLIQSRRRDIASRNVGNNGIVLHNGGI